MDDRIEHAAQQMAALGIPIARARELAQMATAVPPTMGEVMDVIELLANVLGWPCIDSERGETSFSMQFKRGGL